MLGPCLQVRCGLQSFPHQLCALSQVHLLDLSENSGLLKDAGAPLSGVGLASPASCHTLDLTGTTRVELRCGCRLWLCYAMPC